MCWAVVAPARPVARRPIPISACRPCLRVAALAGAGGENYARTAAQIREQTDALIAQSTALMDVAASGVQYGDAVEYARIRSELLTRAQAEGRPITAELTAEIDNLAAAQVSAQDRVDQLTESLRRRARPANAARRR